MSNECSIALMGVISSLGDGHEISGVARWLVIAAMASTRAQMRVAGDQAHAGEAFG